MTQETKKLGAFPYVIAGISFIPLIGVLFGVAAIVWGLVTNKQGGKKLAIIGSLGILFTIVIYSSLYYFGFVHRGGVYDELRERLAITQANQTLQAIEFYKVRYGNYPESLAQVTNALPAESLASIYDPTSEARGKLTEFYYQLINADQYYLLSVGPDNQPFTEDDILPSIQPGGGLGYTVKQ